MAAKRRRASEARPQDPWRGGFGPPMTGSSGNRMNGWVAEPAGGTAVLRPRSVERRRSRDEGGVRGWLGQNGLLRR